MILKLTIKFPNNLNNEQRGREVYLLGTLFGDAYPRPFASSSSASGNSLTYYASVIIDACQPLTWEQWLYLKDHPDYRLSFLAPRPEPTTGTLATVESQNEQERQF